MSIFRFPRVQMETAAPTNAAPTTGDVQLALTNGPRPPSLRPLDDGPRATERLATFQARVDSGLDVWPQTQRLVDAASEARGDLAAYREKHGDAASPTEIKRLEGGVTRADRALAAHRASTAALKADGYAYKSLYTSCARLISTATAGKKMLVDAIPPGTTFDGETLKRLSDLAIEIQSVQQSWQPVEVYIAQMRSRVESKAVESMPRAGIGLEPTGPHDRAKLRPMLTFRWPQKRLAAAPWRDGDELPTITDIEGVSCALFGDQLVRGYESDIEEAFQAYDGPIYTDEERRDKLAELADEKLHLERVVAESWWSAIDAGREPEVSAAHLAKLDLDARALLGVDLIPDPSAKARPKPVPVETLRQR